MAAPEMCGSERGMGSKLTGNYEQKLEIFCITNVYLFSKHYLRDIYKVSTMCQTLLQATEQEGQGSI